MCLEHAAAIDDPMAIAAYPTTRLREWKTAQVEEHRKLLAGWPLTTAMAEQAITASFTNVAVAIHNSTVQLGGGGGRGPGAGGGGGGAIGPNARAGKGGNGGRLRDTDGNELPPETFEQFTGRDENDPPPGSGGGGAGAIGEGAVGGDGGHGADAVTGSFDLEPGDSAEVTVGAGGEAAHLLPGQHAPGGEASIIRVKSAAGELKRVVHVAGPPGVKSGELPEDWATISDIDLKSGFQISSLLTANALDFRDGLLYLLGGGWTSLVVPALPFQAIWPVVCIANWETLSPDVTRGLQLCLTGPSGVEVSRLALELPASEVGGNRYVWWQQLGAPLDEAGRWEISVQSGQYSLSRWGIMVDVKAE